MRIRLLVGAGALLLVCAAAVSAQETTPSTATSELGTGRFDFGFRAMSVDGDPARFQKYRDLRDGATFDKLRWQVDKNTWMFNAEADHVGFRDQRYLAELERFGRIKASFEWVQVPVFMSSDTKSLYAYQGGGVFVIDDAIQRGVETGQFTLASQVGRATPFDLRWRDDFVHFNVVVTPVKDLDLKVGGVSRRRNGQTIYAGNFGFTNAIELAAPLEDRNTDIQTSADWANDRGQFSVGYARSWYDNNVTTLVYDNPIRITDATGGPSRGTRGYWPNNTMNTVSTSGAANLPARSRASASISVGSWKQDDTLVPATINPALPVVPLERPTAKAEARIVGMNYNVNSRPARNLWLNGRYRYYDYDNRTPDFTITNMVVGDASLGAREESLRMSYKRHNVDLDASVTPWAFTALRVGYGREQTHRVARIFDETVENTFRTSIDSTGYQYVTLRAVFEHAVRTGSGFERDLLDEVGEQPSMRHYDLSDRDRNRATFIMTVTPTEIIGLNASIAAGKDDYNDTGIGLRDNDHRVYSVGFDITPDDRVNLNATYGYEKYTALQTSRTANPLSATDVSFNDPRRNWDTDGSDRVHNVSAALELLKVIPKSDLLVDYNYSYSRAVYAYNVASGWTDSLPRLTLPIQLDPLTNRLTDLRADLMYFFTQKIGLGFNYFYETYNVTDFAFEPDATGSIYPLTATGTPASAMYLNYQWRPYTGNVFGMRLRYMW
jgi:MtrB/PioB family decaheme-associated outer membrane protein